MQFGDTLSEEDCRNLNLIYESLLMEGKAGNLTDFTLGMVLAPAWLKVMHGRLNISLSVLKLLKEKRKLSMMLELQQNKPVEEREWEDIPKGLDICGLVEKEREKAP